MCSSYSDANTFGSGGDWEDRPLNPTKVILFAIILYNSENNIRDIRPFCRPLFCHSSVMNLKVCFISLTVAKQL